MLGNFFCAPKTNKQTERQKQSAKQEVEGVEEQVYGVEKRRGEQEDEVTIKLLERHFMI